MSKTGMKHLADEQLFCSNHPKPLRSSAIRRKERLILSTLLARTPLITLAGAAAAKLSPLVLDDRPVLRATRTRQCTGPCSRPLLETVLFNLEPGVSVGFTLPVFPPQPRPTTGKPYTERRTPVYAHDSVRRTYQSSGGIVYKRGILSPDEFHAIRSELEREFRSGGSLRLEPESSSSIAKNRMGTQLPLTTEMVRIIASGSVHQLVNSICSDGGKPWILSTDVAPVEVRVYEKLGAGMDWHRDDVLYDPPQVEVVLTLENTSDCVTSWEEGRGRRVHVETDVNSAIFIQAGGPLHRVSPLKQGGRRVIVKFVYTREDAIPLGKPVNQFAATAKRRKKR